MIDEAGATDDKSITADEGARRQKQKRLKEWEEEVRN